MKLVSGPVGLFMVVILLAFFGLWKLLGLWFWIGIGLYLGQYVLRHWKKLRATKWRDWVNPLKWISVLYATVMRWMFPDHVVEQLIIRMYNSECRECVLGNECKHCHCEMSKVYVPWEECSLHEWGRMIMSKKKYKEYRDDIPVEITVIFPKVGE